MEKQVIISLDEYLNMEEQIKDLNNMIAPVDADISIYRSDFIANPETMFAGYEEKIVIDRDTIKDFLNRVKGTENLDFVFRMK